VLDKARSACVSSSDAPRPPASWSDALAIVQAREEAERRKKDVKKDKSKGGRSSVLAGDPSINPPPPGTHIGQVSEQSVYWLFMEVSLGPCGMQARSSKPCAPCVTRSDAVCAACRTSSAI
jgi:hypothetical protein